jgi:hypothetical protein
VDRTAIRPVPINGFAFHFARVFPEISSNPHFLDQQWRVPAVFPEVQVPARLTESQLTPVVEQAVAHVKSAQDGVDLSQLNEISVEVVDLPGKVLGQVANNAIIQIDIDAAGPGWFVDPTPRDDVEFSHSNDVHELIALPGSPSAGRVDLLTVVLHELGHVLGYDHEDEGVMQESLPSGTRRLWDEGSFIDDPKDFGSEMETLRLGPTVVDKYFATA